MRFKVDSRVLEKEKKKMQKWKFSIIGFAVAGIATAIEFFSDEVQSLWERAERYSDHAKSIPSLYPYSDYKSQVQQEADQLQLAYLIYLAMFVVSVIMLIVSIRKYIKQKPLYNNYLASYIEIDGDTITGLAFHKANEEGYPFSVNVSELTYVYYFGTSPLNLKLCTKTQSYPCLNIERASELARILKQRMTELKEESTTNQ